MTELTAAELAAVADTMTASGVAPAGPLESTLIAGGRSNLTFRLTDGAGRWVLARHPAPVGPRRPTTWRGSTA